jgi:murein tripeptide amidase MpaA
MLNVSTSFDSGAIDVVALPTDPTAPVHLQLAIRQDAATDPTCNFRQWFHFRLQGAKAKACRIDLVNAGACTYPSGWTDYRAVASYDRRDWFRVPTRYDGKVLTIDHTPERDSIYLAYFEPYSGEQHLNLLGRMDSSPFARVSHLGRTVDGRDLDAVVLGSTDPAARKIWVIARQHPGESMAEWFVEGMLERLIDPADAIARQLRARATICVVPNMNPDGSARGNLRANAAGANLNREWQAPSLERSPEVYLVRERLMRTGCDAFVDVHGDEALPYVFIAGNEMLPGFSGEDAARLGRFRDEFSRASPDFQSVHGYPVGQYAAEALKLASKYVGHAFGCLSVTLEMPFKDNANDPDPLRGWSGERSRRLGAAILAPLLGSLV